MREQKVREKRRKEEGREEKSRGKLRDFNLEFQRRFHMKDSLLQLQLAVFEGHLGQKDCFLNFKLRILLERRSPEIADVRNHLFPGQTGPWKMDGEGLPCDSRKRPPLIG